MDITLLPKSVRHAIDVPHRRLHMLRLAKLFRQIAPELHIDDAGFIAGQAGLRDLAACDFAEAVRRFEVEGFCIQRMPPAYWDALRLGRMRDAIGALAAAKIPPVFAFVFDEFWLAYLALHPLCAALLRDPSYCLLPDFWVWHVNAANAEGGWPMHRDGGPRALFEDGRTGAASAWIPLTPVNSTVGAMMLLPRDRDPHYGSNMASVSGFDVRDIRLLAGEPGDVMVWSQAILHWGSRGSRFSEHPRISMSMGIQHSQLAPLNTPVLQTDMMPLIALRLEMIAKQLLQYAQHGAVAPEWQRFAKFIFAANPSGINYSLPEAWKLT